MVSRALLLAGVEPDLSVGVSVPRQPGALHAHRIGEAVRLGVLPQSRDQLDRRVHSRSGYRTAYVMLTITQGYELVHVANSLGVNCGFGTGAS